METNWTPGPWRWENGEYDCGIPCTPDGCKGHDSGVPEYLTPVGMWVPEPPNDTEKWIANASIIKAAPDLLAICRAMQAHLERKRDDYDCGVGVPGAYMRDMDPGAAELWAQLDAAIAKATEAPDAP